MNLSDYFVIFLLIAITWLLIHANNVIKHIEQEKYKVYYEYNVINNDTIPCDTIWVKL